MGLLAKARRDDDKGSHLLLGCKILHILRAEPRCHHEDGQVGGGHPLHVVEHLDTLHFVFLGVYNVQGSIVTATNQITHNRAAWLMHVIRAADDDNALRV